MARCPFCKDDIREWDIKRKGYLILTQTIDDHIHAHGTFDKQDVLKELIQAGIDHAKLGDYFHTGKAPQIAAENKPPAEVVFRNRQRIGDMLMFTCGVRDFKKAFPATRVNVISTAPHIWDNNPYIDRDLVPTNENIVKIGPNKLTNMSNRLDWHFANAFRVSIEENLGVRIPQGPPKPDIWLTRAEWEAPPVIDVPYWLICIGGEKGWGCKMFPYEKWQAFVEQNPDVTFVQIGTTEDSHPRLKGSNVIDYIGKTQNGQTGIRDIFKLFLNAEGSIGLVSFHMHLSAAFDKPCIVIDGAREPNNFTNYPYQQRLRTDGCLPCADAKACWHCGLDTCDDLLEYPDAAEELDRKVPRCVDILLPEDLTLALKRYYLGGRLKSGVRLARPKKFTNIVAEAAIFTPPKIPKEPVAPPPIPQQALQFGGKEITDRDWDFIEKTLKQYNVETVLEFGANLSTLLLNKTCRKVVTYETSQNRIQEIKKLEPTCIINYWDGKVLPKLAERFDMVFVDGPPGGGNREWSVKESTNYSDLVIVHDAGRDQEKKWQQKYLASTYTGPTKGGHRCHLWQRAGLEKPVEKEESIEISRVSTRPAICAAPGKKFIKFVSTARGWGGCARSCVTIMKHLIKQEHTVEFIPFRNRVGSREYQEALQSELRDVIVTTTYDSIAEPCDVLFVYGDDYIWEFKRPDVADVFSNLKAARKIMMLNYRRGDVGKIEWTKGWDKYMFLNSTQEQELLQVLPGVKTKVLPPCTDLAPFLDVKPHYQDGVRIVRHSSQGDTKFDKESFEIEVNTILSTREDVTIDLLPGPSFGDFGSRVKRHPRTADPHVIANFLGLGNLFWYSLPSGYMDMGPRVILEAMAVGLPILADNWGGAADRVNIHCGKLCDTKDQMVEFVRNTTTRDLELMGISARQRAIDEFVPERWIQNIVGD